MAAEDLKWACDELKGSNKRIAAYRTYEKYYDGDHPLAFATRKFRSVFWGIFSKFADNLCESVVDIQAERLELVGFTSNSKGADTAGKDAWDRWEENDMDLVADEVHKDALLYGDGFTIVGDDGELWAQEPCQMAVRYSEDTPGLIEVAAKIWPNADKTLNLNLYYSDHVEHYKTSRPLSGTTVIKPQLFAPDGDDTPTKAMAVQHFPNRAYSAYGRSELAPVLPLQDALNKSVIDTIVAMEYQAFRQRWVTGVDVEIGDDGKPKNVQAAHGPGEYNAFPGENVQVGEFGQMEVAGLMSVVDGFRAEVARVCGIPLHYFYVGSGGASETGEALKTSETRFTRKGKRQQRAFGKGWENALAAALVAAGDVEGSAAATLDLNAVWEPVTPRSDSEKLDVLIKKQAIGIPNNQLQKEAGYDDDQIEEFAKAPPPKAVAKTTEEEGSPNDPGTDPPGPAAPVSAVPQHGGAEPVAAA